MWQAANLSLLAFERFGERLPAEGELQSGVAVDATPGGRTETAHEVTGFAGVPPLWNQVVRYLDEVRAPLPSLRRP